MGANWSITFVSKDGDELSIPADIVSACSPVWRDRLKETGVFDKSPRSEESCTQEQLECFKSILMSVTTSDVEQDKDGSKFGYTWPPSKDDLPGVTVMGALTQALPLVHKYDCENLLCCYVDRLDEMCFPVSTTQRKVTNEYGTPTAVTPLAKYLEQTHLDFIVTLQALYDRGNEGGAGFLPWFFCQMVHCDLSATGQELCRQGQGPQRAVGPSKAR